jgi:hypothetical protein
MTHILLDLNDYIDLWFNTRLVHDIYLKGMGGHFSMIAYEKLSSKALCNIFFCINKLLQVATLVGAVDVSLQGFYHVKTSVC